MARKYCLEYGVLEPQEAARLLKEMVKSKKWLFVDRSVPTDLISNKYSISDHLSIADA